MEPNIDPAVFESLTSEQKEAFLLSVMVACARGTYTLESAAIKRFQSAVARLPMVLNPYFVEELLEEAKLRYDAADDQGFGEWMTEIATPLADPGLRENVVVAMSDAMAGGTALPVPSKEQTDTLLCGLLLASAGGSTLDADGVRRFRDAAAKIADVIDSADLQAQISAANTSYDASEEPNVASWLSEIASLVQDAKLREGTLSAIGHASVEAVDEDVSWIMNQAQYAFGIDPSRMMELRQVKLPSFALPSLTGKVLNPFK